VIPGRANRLLAKFADKTAISFPETRNYYKIPQERIVLTGNPLRRGLKKIDKAEALSFFGLNSDKFTILVMGGSQGSRRINRALLRAVSLMPDKSKFQVIHIAGENEFGLLNQGYKDSLVKFKLFTFLNQMQYAYSGADLAICRAGATTISELIFYRLPAIIIPYPFAYKHQLSNAKVLERMQSALVIDDSELDTVILNMILDEIVKNPKKIDVMRSRFRGILKTEASNLLVDEALSLV
jgi:UDP-N-acetylglucosamine--N-acetylmuramyl-(pentapeptide) pyrophosphoryl-undecaprenol N-acetylglucosamine transferase